MNCQTHEGHTHTHGEACGHKRVQHDGHTDYLHEGHMHFVHDNHVDEHELSASSQYPDRCTPEHKCGKHEGAHKHGPGCGHEAVPHAGHTDYVVAGHLHHPHGAHCDDHGAIELR
jgi:hypothetical protein